MEKPAMIAVSAMDAFKKLEKVGEGTYDKAYRAREKATSKIIALKKTCLHEDEEGPSHHSPRGLYSPNALKGPTRRLVDLALNAMLCGFGKCGNGKSWIWTEPSQVWLMFDLKLETT